MEYKGFKVHWMIVVTLISTASFWAFYMVAWPKLNVKAVPDLAKVVTVKQLETLLAEEDNAKKVYVARVQVHGPILTKKERLVGLVTSVTYADAFAKTMTKLAANTRVAAIVVEYSTPGGTVPGSEIIEAAIKRTLAIKPVFAYIVDLSASGGVWSMVSAKKVFAQPGSLVGSIGVAGPTLIRYQGLKSMGSIFSGRYEAKEITGTVLFAGKGKALGNPFHTPTPDELALFQSFIQDSYDAFTTRVASLRKIEKATVEGMGASIVTATRAAKIGLIDGVMNRSAFERTIKADLGLKEPDELTFVTVGEPKPKRGLAAWLSNSLRLSPANLAETATESANAALHRLLRSQPHLMIWQPWLAAQ